MSLSLIAAMTENRVIANGGEIPWDIPEDRRLFRELTRGHMVLMGRKTFETIGKALADRRILVLSRKPGPAFESDEIRFVKSLEAALTHAQNEDELFVAGGESIYRQTIHLAEKIYLTIIDKNMKGDRFFPEIPNEFQLVETRQLTQDPRSHLNIYKRL